MLRRPEMSSNRSVTAKEVLIFKVVYLFCEKFGIDYERGYDFDIIENKEGGSEYLIISVKLPTDPRGTLAFHIQKGKKGWHVISFKQKGRGNLSLYFSRLSAISLAGIKRIDKNFNWQRFLTLEHTTKEISFKRE